MLQTVTAKQARQNFSQLLNQVGYGGQQVLIMRFGKPLAVLSAIDTYDPGKAVNKNQLQTDDFKIIDQIRANGKPLSAKTAKQLVKEAIEHYKTK